MTQGQFSATITITPRAPPSFPTPPLGQDMTQGQIFKRGLTGCEELSLLYYLPIAGGRIIRFIPFPRVLVLCEMLSFSARIWTRVAVSISYDDNHYTTGTSYIFNNQSQKIKPCMQSKIGLATKNVYILTIW